MVHKIYFWMLFVIFLSLGFLIKIQKANAMTAAEVEPGIIELSTTNIYGFEIVEVGEKEIKDKEWIYFCIAELKPKKSHKNKCFYGLKRDFSKVKVGAILNGIQYGLKDRIHNSKGYIPLRKNGYFYPARVLRPQYVSLVD